MDEADVRVKAIIDGCAAQDSADMKGVWPGKWQKHDRLVASAPAAAPAAAAAASSSSKQQKARVSRAALHVYGFTGSCENRFTSSSSVFSL